MDRDEKKIRLVVPFCLGFRAKGAADRSRQPGVAIGQLRAQAYEKQIKRILCHLAMTWYRLKRDVHPQVLREAMEWVLKDAPAIERDNLLKMDWLYAIAAAENLGERIAKSEGRFDLSVWQVRVFAKDDDALNRQVEQLRAEARSATGPKILDSKLGTSWD